MSEFIKENQIITIFPYVDVALKMFFCNSASNYSTKRLYLSLHWKKTYLKSSISSERFNIFAILNVTIVTHKKSLNYPDVIKIFASK